MNTPNPLQSRLIPSSCLSLVVALLLGVSMPASAQNLVFKSGFEDQTIGALFPLVDGDYVLPPSSGGQQVQWFLEQLDPAANPTDQEILDHFDSTWLAAFSIQQTKDFLTDARMAYPNGRVTDLINLTPMSFTGLVQGENNDQEAFVTMGVRFSENKIYSLSVSFFGNGQGGVITPGDAALTMAQAADRFASLSNAPALLVGQVNANGECTVIEERNLTTRRATASIFKIWVAGAIAEAITESVVAIDEMVARVDAERVAGGPVIDEPNNTLFTVLELGQLMLGISDNTATDLLHELAGRTRLNAILSTFGHAEPLAFAPFLSVGETFHLLFSFTANDAQSYAAGTELFQQQFVADQIEPKGSFADTGGGFNNGLLYPELTWTASPMDVCNAFAAHRQWPRGSNALAFAEQTLGVEAAQPRVRPQWDRVWYKGGSLSFDLANSGTFSLVVLNHAWLLENGGQDAYVVVALSNDSANEVDQFAVQSVLGRILQLVAER